MKRNVKIIIGVITCLSGLSLMFSNYYLSLKHEIFDNMNKLYYEQLIAESDIIEELDDVILEEEKQDVVVEQPVIEEPIKEEVIKPVPYVQSYIGYLRVPKINLNRGFYNINSELNDVSKNIYVHPASTFPSDSNNLILASHSGTSSISYFKNLFKLELGDDIYIDYNNKEYHYKIKDIYKVSKTGTVGLRINKDVSTVTLITCTKDDKNSQTVYICELV